MKRLISIFLMVIGITTLSFSQTIYPAKILFKNDTVLAITKPQLVKVNRALNDYVHLKEAYKLIQMDLAVSDSVITLYKQTITKQQDIINLQEKRYNTQTTLFEESRARDKKKSRNKTIGVGVGGTLLGILLGVLLIK